MNKKPFFTLNKMFVRKKNMLNIFDLNIATEVTILGDEEIWDNLNELITDESVFALQGDEHENIDLRLVNKIDEFLFPLLGDYDENEEWYHSLLCNLDGSRSLSFNFIDLSTPIVVGLQQLLNGECSDFCIICNIHTKFSSEQDSRIGTILILADKVIIAREVAASTTNTQ